MHDPTTNFPAAILSPKTRRPAAGAPSFADSLLTGAPLFAGVAIAWTTSLDDAPFVRMVWLALAIYGGLKWFTWHRAVRNGQVRSVARSFAYLIAWPGMDARRFFDESAKPSRASRLEWCFAAAKTLTGVAIVRMTSDWLRAPAPLLAGWIGLAGLVLTVHFGVFHLLALAWRRLGVDARPIMDWPLLAQSPSDFWSRRWNLAFRDLAFGIAFRPIARCLGGRRLGGGLAILAIFTASGIIHDFVISVPAHGGYGLPTLYFLLQGAAVCFERSRTARSLGLTRGARGRLFAAAVVLLPLAMLFHPPFIHRVVLPLLRAISIG